MNLRNAFALLALLPLPSLAVHDPLEPQVAKYHVQYGSIGLGEAHFVLNEAKDNSYLYELNSELSLLIVSDERYITSQFTRNDDQLTPVLFEHKRTGTGSDFSERISFAKDVGKVFSVYKAERKTLDYSGDLYDAMMVQLQFRLDLSEGKQTFAYNMVKDNKIKDYTFTNLGEADISIEGKQYHTVRLAVKRDTDKRHTEVWMAPALGYLPVRFIHQKKGDSALQLTLTNVAFGPAAVRDYFTKTK